MSVSVYLKGDYVKNEGFRVRKNKANSKPILRKDKSKKAKVKMKANPEVVRHGDLKKQSQFSGWQIGVKSLITMVYGNVRSWRWRENKAKQSQTKPIQSQTKPIA